MDTSSKSFPAIDDKASVNPLIYIIASLTGLAIGWLSIFSQALKAANSNPTEALRYK